MFNLLKMLASLILAIGVYQPKIINKTPKKVALLIGINEYAPNTQWPKIHGENDVALIKKTLLQRGFEQDHIHLLKGKSVTKKNILRKLKEIEKQLTKKSFFIFHFSGHGQQLPDEWSTVKDEVDKLDESLALYNSPMEITKGYDGSTHLIDDEMEAYLEPIRKKIGTDGQLLLLVDACHSGTITRSKVTSMSNPIRGSYEECTPANFTTLPREGKKEITGFQTKSERDDLADYVVISATRPGDRNQEILVNDTLYGPLSYAFSTAFTQLPNTENYQRLFKDIQIWMTNMVANQAPCIEGNQALIVGSSGLRPLDNAYEQFVFEEKNILKMPIGKMAGIHEGSSFAFYPKAADTTGQLVATGKVIQAGLSTARIRLQWRSGKNSLKIQKAYLQQQDFGDIAIRVGLDIDNKKLETLIRKKCATIAAIKIVPQSAGIVIQQKKDQAIQVYVDNSLILEKNLVNLQDDVSSLVEQTILQYAQIKFLKKLELQDQSVRLTAKVILDDRDAYTQQYLGQAKQRQNPQGLLYVPKDTHYYFEIKNESDREIFLSMLEISPDYTYFAPLPYDDLGLKIEDYAIPAKSTITLDKEVWSMRPPLGIEHFYIFGTDQPLDLKGLIDNEQPRDISLTHDFDKIFELIEPKNRRRTGKILPIVPTKINIEKLLVEIIE